MSTVQVRLKTMKVLIIGGSGMLGHKLVRAWREKFDVWITIRGRLDVYKQYKLCSEKKTRSNINVEDIEAVETVIKTIKPDVIVNAVGIIKQIETSKDIIKTLTINAIFPHQLAVLAKSYDSRLIIISTDCVFNGKKGNYSEAIRNFKQATIYATDTDDTVEYNESIERVKNKLLLNEKFVYVIK